MRLAVQTPVHEALRQRQGSASWNLELDKFSFEREGGDTAKTSALQRAVRSYQQKATPYLAKAAARTTTWLAALAQCHRDRFRRITLHNTSPLILHLGRASVLENVGFHTDRTTGLPVIPGSAVKGVLSTWAAWEANQKTDGTFPPPDDWTLRRAGLTDRILGCNHDGGSTHAGDIVFVGGFPKSPPALVLDIVNPHHDDQGRDKTRLTPSVFLSLRPGTAWDFVFFARPGTDDAAALLDVTGRWLREALEQAGLGAKTAAGYGRFGIQSVVTATGGEAPSVEDLARREQAVEALRSDYPNDQTFKTLVLDKLNPGQIAQLEKEVPKLQKPANAAHLQRLKDTLATRDFKDLRKKLREKPWFPQDWLPS